jgi:hypothetical protein
VGLPHQVEVRRAGENLRQQALGVGQPTLPRQNLREQMTGRQGV